MHREIVNPATSELLSPRSPGEDGACGVQAE
jgi:hypothetical protein